MECSNKTSDTIANRDTLGNALKAAAVISFALAGGAAGKLYADRKVMGHREEFKRLYDDLATKHPNFTGLQPATLEEFTQKLKMLEAAVIRAKRQRTPIIIGATVLSASVTAALVCILLKKITTLMAQESTHQKK